MYEILILSKHSAGQE